MPKYWGKQMFSLGRFPEVVKSKRQKRKKEERAKVGNNNGQLRIATPPRVAHAKPPGPIPNISGDTGRTASLQTHTHTGLCVCIELSATKNKA